LTTLEASRKKWYDIQKLLIEMNYVVTDLRRNFNGYPDTGLEEKHIIYDKLGSVPDVVWYWAALLRFVFRPNGSLFPKAYQPHY